MNKALVNTLVSEKLDAAERGALPTKWQRRAIQGKGKWEAPYYDYLAKEFPGGFGYALYASGDAGPEAPAEIVKAALSGIKEQPQIDPADLTAIWSSGSR